MDKPHKKALTDALEPVFSAVRKLSAGGLDDVASVYAQLTEQFPVEGAVLQKVRDAFAAGIEAGELCHRENGGVHFSRLLKPSEDMPWSIDLVRMNGPGPGHTHPRGEVDLCFNATADEALFDENPEGFTVYPPGSWHVPTVSEGTMNIIYFLPEGAIEFGDAPA